MQRGKDRAIRTQYMRQTQTHGGSRNVLLLMVESGVHDRQRKAITKFQEKLPPQSDLLQQTLKDPNLYNFPALQEPFHERERERELETSLLEQVQRFLLELGQGLAFMGGQYRIEVGNRDFYIELLCYQRKLRVLW